MFFSDTKRSCAIDDIGTMTIGKKVTAMYMFKEVTHEIREVKEKGAKIITQIATPSNSRTDTSFEWLYDDVDNVYRKKDSKQVLLRPF